MRLPTTCQPFASLVARGPKALVDCFQGRQSHCRTPIKGCQLPQRCAGGMSQNLGNPKLGKIDSNKSTLKDDAISKQDVEDLFSLVAGSRVVVGSPFVYFIASLGIFSLVQPAKRLRRAPSPRTRSYRQCCLPDTHSLCKLCLLGVPRAGTPGLPFFVFGC